MIIAPELPTLLWDSKRGNADLPIEFRCCTCDELLAWCMSDNTIDPQHMSDVPPCQTHPDHPMYFCIGPEFFPEDVGPIIRDDSGPIAQEEDERCEVLRDAISKLRPDEADVIVRRFGLGDGFPWTLSEIGEQIGKTTERARQLQAAALRVLRRRIDAVDAPLDYLSMLVSKSHFSTGTMIFLCGAGVVYVYQAYELGPDAIATIAPRDREDMEYIAGRLGISIGERFSGEMRRQILDRAVAVRATRVRSLSIAHAMSYYPRVFHLDLLSPRPGRDGLIDWISGVVLGDARSPRAADQEIFIIDPNTPLPKTITWRDLARARVRVPPDGLSPEDRMIRIADNQRLLYDAVRGVTVRA